MAMNREMSVIQPDRRVSLVNIRRLDSKIDPKSLETARSQSPNGPPASELETPTISKSKFIDDTLKDIEVDGWRSLIKANSFLSRAFWLIISMLCLTLLIYEVYAVLDNYYSRPLSTSYQIKTNGSLIMPRIYICPMNGINWSAIDADKALIPYAWQIKQIVGIIDYEGYVGQLATKAKPFNFTLVDAYEKFMQFGYSAQQFMVACSFIQSFASYITCSDLAEPKMDQLYGKCFVLELGPNRTQTTPGRGLTISFHIHKELYPTITEFAPMTDGVAIYVGDELIYLRPGSRYNIEVKMEHLKLINCDRGRVSYHCVGNGQHTFEYAVINRDTDAYNQRECIRDCYYREIWTICQCLPIIDPSDVKPEILNGASPAMLCDASRLIKCVRPKVDNDPDVRNRVDRCKSHCLPACDFKRYILRVSDAPLNKVGYKHILEYFNTTIDNLIDVSLAHPSLDYAEFQQDISKSFDELVSDLGGQIGLWMGASMVTIIQIPFVLTTLCMYTSFRKAGVVKGAMVRQARRFTNPQNNLG